MQTICSAFVQVVSSFPPRLRSYGTIVNEYVFEIDWMPNGDAHASRVAKEPGSAYHAGRDGDLAKLDMMALQDQDKLRLRALSGSVAGQVWIVTPEQPLVLGRVAPTEPGMDGATIPDPRVSSRHCRIEHAGGGFRVVDLKSTNGMQLNGRRVPVGGSEALADGDVLTLGGVALKIDLGTRRCDEPVADESFSTVVADGDRAGLVTELTPFPLAMCIRKVAQAMVAQESVNEVLRSFEVVLQFQTLAALAEYCAGDRRSVEVDRLLAAFQERPFSLGRWLELHTAVTDAIAADTNLVVHELAVFGAESDLEIRHWRKTAGRLVEIRNNLIHGDGLTSNSAERFCREATDLFAQLMAPMAFWMGYRFIAVEPGDWSDEDKAFVYPCRLLQGCSTPFETRRLATPSPLPSRVPIIVGRDSTSRLSLAPFQAFLPAEDTQLHWFWLSECTRTKTSLVTYPAGFRVPAAAPEAIAGLLGAGARPSGARGPFSGTFGSE